MREITKTPTGIRGLDAITGGGLPTGRPTLVIGGPGCGKTLLSIEFIVKGITQFRENGVFIAFEERASELEANVASLGFDLQKLQKQKKLRLDYIRIERNEIEETGEYDLEGLFIRLNHAIDSIGARRVVLDTIENLFSGLKNKALLRAELRRLFHWLKDKGVTAIVTAETGNAGSGSLTRHNLEEYVSDCVIQLDNRIIEQISTRRLRIVKYRGSTHGTNEYPFLIDEDGLSILPITTMRLQKIVSTNRISSGIPSLDAMLGIHGFYRGSSILVSGTSGTGKTSIAVHFAKAACDRKEKCIYFAFEESSAQIIRNMRSIGLDLEPYVKKGLLKLHTVLPTEFGLEMHLVSIHKIIREFKPRLVIIDPITNLVSVGQARDVKSMLLRLIDMLGSENITALFTALTLQSSLTEQTDETLSSHVDTWIQLRDLEAGGERNKGLYILKSRGMAHSNQVREFVISDGGVELIDIYLGPTGVLTGSARLEAQILDHGDGKSPNQRMRNQWARERQRSQVNRGMKKTKKPVSNGKGN
jgi:circadian clock protein KaiC